MQPRKELDHIDKQVYCYAFPRKIDVKASDAVITGTILFHDRIAFVLFDLWSTYSYLSVKFSMGLNLVFNVHNYLVYVSTLVGEFVVVTHVYRSYFVLFVGF